MDKEANEAVELAEETDGWVGRYTVFPNYREGASLTVTRDFFGSAECRAAVRSIYDRISRSLLTELEQLGFDISAYRDDKGRWSINTDKIEQLVVGERITIAADNRRKATETNAAKPAEPAVTHA
ncbi:MAG: hypothetical protein ACM31C_16245 [Acidobacteriota bacterium]